MKIWLVSIVVAATTLFLPTAQADEPPCTGPAADDEWPTFGRDLANTRLQTEAGGISPLTTPTLHPVWAHSTGAPAATGDLNGTPIVSDGCVFLNTAAGKVVALDAATGAPVWSTTVPLDPGTAAGLGGIFVSSPAVHEGLVLALVSQVGSPYVIALSAATGEVVWRSEPTMTGDGYYTNATAVVAGDVLLAGFSPAEGDPKGQGGIALLDAHTGDLLQRVFAIPEADQGEYAGGGIWTAPAVDDDLYAYAGTSNPYSKKVEHQNTNAILKIDVDPTRDTFGTVVDSFKGVIEQYRQEVRDAVDPTCEAFGEDPNLQLIVGDSAPCLQLDLDFGSPPTLFPAADGAPLVGDLQKAGVFHAVRTSDMEREWDAIVGGSCAACNAAAWAYDGDGHMIGASAPGSLEVALDQAGALTWASPIGDGTHYQSTSIAGGVVFTVDNLGTLVAFDLATGLPLLKRPVLADAPGSVAPGVTSAGIAIASGMVIVATGDVVVAYAP